MIQNEQTAFGRIFFQLLCNPYQHPRRSHSATSTTSFVQLTPWSILSNPALIAPKPFPTMLGSGLGLMAPLARLSLSHVPSQYRNCSSLSSLTDDAVTDIVSTPFT